LERRFEGKVVVITGATGDIGRATALRFAAEGACLVLVGRREAPLAEVVEAVEQVGGIARPVTADVSRASDVALYATEAVRLFGGIDCFFNNAGIEGYIGTLVEYPEEIFDRVIAVNLKGTWLGLKQVGPIMRQRGGGAIVNYASTAGLRGGNLVAYVASKHAVVGMTYSAAVEFAPFGIRVNAVCPAPIEGRMMRAFEQGMDPAHPEAVHRQIAASSPLGRYGKPEEVAALVTFLCSSDASYITGNAYPIDGGSLAS
jgi:NAD(P)-dependent dehydrogenase (short-subunit alcohol dehydrogenase family)